MITLYDKRGRAIIRLIDDWFAAFSESIHLGWLWGSAVYNRYGKHVGWFENGILRDKRGEIVAIDEGMIYPEVAAIPDKPERPPFTIRSAIPLYSSTWSEVDYKKFFEIEKDPI